MDFNTGGMVWNADLPKDVSLLIARLDLNGMTFVCKRCEGMNREIHCQLTRDMSYLVEQRWGWTTTCSVLSAIVASQAATEKPVWAPRPSASTGAAGATVTPRSPLPGTASSREVLGPLARHTR